jgi:hypothetical protein
MSFNGTSNNFKGLKTGSVEKIDEFTNPHLCK